MEDDYHQSNANAGFPVGRIGGGDIGNGVGFPMTDFSGAGSASWKKRSRDFGAFLARQGDEKRVEAVGPGGCVFSASLQVTAPPVATRIYLPLSFIRKSVSGWLLVTDRNTTAT